LSANKGTGNDEALPSSRATHGSAWPALRPRWFLSRLAYHATTDAAFRHVETVRVRESDSGSHLRFSLAGPHLSNNFRGSITHPTVLIHPASDLCLLRPTGFTTGLVASLCPGRISTSWIAKTNFYGVPTPRPKVTDLTWHDPGRISDCSTNPPTEPDVKVSLIRFLGTACFHTVRLTPAGKTTRITRLRPQDITPPDPHSRHLPE